MNFEEYVDENIEHVAKIREKLKARFGAIDRDLELLLARAAVEPWGFVQKGNVTHAAANHTNSNEEISANGSGKAAATDSVVVEIMTKWGLIDDNGKLKAKKYIQPDDFTILARELEQHGYKYSKNARGFILPPKGVKS